MKLIILILPLFLLISCSREYVTQEAFDNSVTKPEFGYLTSDNDFKIIYNYKNLIVSGESSLEDLYTMVDNDEGLDFGFKARKDPVIFDEKEMKVDLYWHDSSDSIVSEISITFYRSEGDDEFWQYSTRVREESVYVKGKPIILVEDTTLTTSSDEKLYILGATYSGGYNISFEPPEGIYLE
jgi:hypothetical protein